MELIFKLKISVYKELTLFGETSKDEIPETLIQIDYINGQERLQQISIKQSFPNTLLK